MIADLFAKLRGLKVNIQLVNDTLDIQAPKGVLDAALINEIKTNKAELIQFIKTYRNNKDDFGAIAQLPPQESYVLSSSQRRLWISSQFEEANVAYNMSATYVFVGEFNRAALEHAFRKLVERHESLRTYFRANEEGKIRQFIRPVSDTGFHIAYHSLLDVPDEQLGLQLKTMLDEMTKAPFDLSEGPLVRAALYATRESHWVFCYCLHHIISDGWSMGIMLSELLVLYSSYAKGKAISLPPLRIHYKDYAAWQQEQLSGENLQQHRNYWLKQFEGELPVLQLHGDHPRPPMKTFNGGSERRMINASLTHAIKNLCQLQGATLFMGLLASVNAVLYKYTGQHDIVIGTQIAGREHADLHDQIGFYLNTLALRTRFSETDSFNDLLANTRKVTLGAYHHQVYPFDELVQELPIERDLSRNPLYDVSVVLQNTEGNTGGAGEALEKGQSLDMGKMFIGVHDAHDDIVTSQFDLAFDFAEGGGDIRVAVNYNSDIFNGHTVGQLLDHLLQVIDAATKQPDLPLNELEYLTEGEKMELLETFNQSATEYPRNKTVAELFAEQVAQTPDATALEFENTVLSYAQLNERANRLALYLRENHQVQLGDHIGLLLDRSDNLMVAILAILQCGAAYVPIDTDYPKLRQSFIARDTNLKVLVTQTDYLFEADFFTGPMVALDVQLEGMALPVQPVTSAAGPDSPVYIMYTSGSTGTPKGVVVPNRAVVRLVKHTNIVPLTGQTAILSTGAVSFDATTFEYWATLLNGGRLILCRKETLLDEERLAMAIQHHRANMMWFTAGWLHQLIDKSPNIFTGLQVVLAGGDRLSPPHIAQLKQLYPTITVINGYGPTENTTFSLTHVIGETVGDNIPVGRPISNSTAYIFNPEGRLLPVGAVGEICVGGDGLAIGYLNQPELTAEKFTDNPYRPGERMYKTGDLGKWLPDGTVAFVGRRDEQVKVRGFRIELAEIEAMLQGHPAVEATVVLARPNRSGEKEIVAYVVSKEQLTATALATYVGATLPAYMVPSHFVQLNALPLNANGKVDKYQLPDPFGASMHSGVAYVAPRNATEEKLVAIWQEILDREKIGVKDNFFDLGGHSLRATRLASQLHKAFDVRIELKDLFAQPVLEDQARLIEQAQKSSFVAIEPLASQESYVLSSSQRRMWVLNQFEEGSLAYNMSGAYIFQGQLDVPAFEKSFDSLIARHESLRTVFKEDGQGDVRQYILQPGTTGFAIELGDLRGQTDIEGNVKTLVHNQFSTPFKLSEGPLLRAALYQVSDNDWVFSYVMHHIISDGWSMGIMINELLQLYNAYSSDEPAALQPLRIQYKDFAAWQQQQLSGEQLERHKSYWLNQFAGELPVLELAGDKMRPAMQTFNGRSTGRLVNAQVSHALRALSQEKGGTLFMGMLAAVNALLHRYTGQEDFVIGSPIAGREHADLHDQIGFYVNTLALRTRFAGTDSYRSLLHHVQEVTMGAYEHQVYPFDELVNNLPLHRDLSRNALFDVMVVLQNNEAQMGGAAQTLGNLQVAPYGGAEQNASQFDMTFTFIEAGEEIYVGLEYNTDIYADNSMERLADHLVQLMGQMALHPDKPLAELDYLTDAQKQQLLQDFNHTGKEYPQDKTVLQLVEAQAQRVPDNIAVVAANATLTYRQLNETANQLAAHLQQQGIAPGDLVAIQLPRSEWMIAVILGIFKAGAAYVPIDTAYPPERIQFIINDSGCKTVVDEVWIGDFAQRQQQYATANPAPLQVPSDTAYIIYTSGTTGQPKGTVVTHGSLANRILAEADMLGVNAQTVTCLTTNYIFDVSLLELFLPITTGGSLVVPTQEQVEAPDQLFTVIKDKAVTMLQGTPSFVLHILSGVEMEAGQMPALALRQLCIGGESLPPDMVKLLKSILPQVIINNHYGPTETTIDAITLPDVQSVERNLIGRPMPDTTVYILDGQLQLMPVGVVGEICIGGAGVAVGYLNRPELTAEKFVSNPFVPGSRLYRTGDLGRWLEDGTIEFIGRKDDQVKVRGFRVELGEIETALQHYPDITAVAVTAQPNVHGQLDLVAYLTATAAPSPAELQAYLASKLPAYMVPSYYVQLDAMPLGPTGKVDRKRLLQVAGPVMGSSAEYVAPRNDAEAQLVQIWQEVLGHEKVGVKDNFFELGGHSLNAVQVISRINYQLGVKVNIHSIFMSPTIEQLGEEILFIKDQSERKRDKTDLFEIDL
jgi:amino acid adenylation domain-containing protein